MLKEFPVIINGTELFPSNKWEESSNVVENVYETEAGTDQVAVTRYDKLSISAQYRCHTKWMGIFKQWANSDGLTVKIYDAQANGYKSRTMRMRGFKSMLIEFSEKVVDTNGVWDVSFSLEEF